MVVFFFFQAEDGIRDYRVTGVQTCALPICRAGPGPRGRRAGAANAGPTRAGAAEGSPPRRRRDRKSGAEGKSVELGGRRIIKKKKGRAGWTGCAYGVQSDQFSTTTEVLTTA